MRRCESAPVRGSRAPGVAGVFGSVACVFACNSSLEAAAAPAAASSSNEIPSAPAAANPPLAMALPDAPATAPPTPTAPSSEDPSGALPLGEPEHATSGATGSAAGGAGGAGSAGEDPDAGAAPADPSTTGGSGGPVGPAELVSTGGLSYQIDAPPGDAARGLLILLHGSTASNYENFVRLMQDVATAYDLIPVSVLAPNGQGWNEGNQVRAAELLHRLVQEDLYTQYNVDETRVLFSGQSSGGGFLSSNFVPAHAQDYQGGAFMQCGAAPPNLAFMPSSDTRQKFRLHFEITTGDPIWPESYAAAIAAYTNAQMQFTMDNTKPGGHCQFDQQQVIFDHIGFVLSGATAAP